MNNLRDIRNTISKFIKKRETLIVILLGLIIMCSLNILMLQYNEQRWTNPKVGFWTAFWNHFEISGFDPYTYILISKWRPLYIIERHPLLSFMMWPFSELNEWLKEATGINCAIYIVAVLWTIISTFSWVLIYKIHRRILEMSFSNSLLLTYFFFSFSHVLLITFVEDHMALTLPLLLLTIYLAGKAIKENKVMPLWQSLLMLFFATGVTTTNMVKVGLADLFTQWGKKSFLGLVKHFVIYAIPLTLIGGLYFYQKGTTQAQENKNVLKTVSHRAKRDSVFASNWKKQQIEYKMIKEKQILNFSFVTNTDYKIDRLPSVVENIFGEGLILHERYTLKDSNKKNRPVLVRYVNKWLYVVEGGIVLLFLLGIWCGRKERIMWMVMSMFLFDMLLHVGLNFASADVYIMTAHWAFVIPITMAYLIKKTVTMPKVNTAILTTILFLTIFMFGHNLQLIAQYILK